jgi:predicted nucleic acid-binding protein
MIKTIFDPFAVWKWNSVILTAFVRTIKCVPVHFRILDGQNVCLQGYNNNPKFDYLIKSNEGQYPAKRGGQIGFSAITMIEIVYLIEKARIKSTTLTRLLKAIDRNDAALTELPVTRETALNLRSISRTSVPDMPDRIIAATALARKVPVISRDRKIKISGLETIW